MQELKFRAWHKKLKLMGDVMTLHFGENANQDIEVDLHTQEGRFLTDTISAFEILQYTGEKDEGGAEIYEGDVVLPQYNCLRKVTVSFNGGKFNISEYCLAKCKVLGNVHENPELKGTSEQAR